MAKNLRKEPEMAVVRKSQLNNNNNNDNALVLMGSFIIVD